VKVIIVHMNTLKLGLHEMNPKFFVRPYEGYCDMKIRYVSDST